MLIFMVRVMFIVEDSVVTVKYRTATKELFIYFNLCPSVMLDSLSCPYPFLLIDIQCYLLCSVELMKHFPMFNV